MCFWIADKNITNFDLSNNSNNLSENIDMKNIYDLMINNHRLYLLLCLFILSIFVEERRQWTATQLMNMLVEKAREEEVNVIELPAMSFDPEEWMETEELKDRCERMWFEIVERYSIWENKWYAMRMEL